MENTKTIAELENMLRFGKERYSKMSYRGEGRGRVLKTNNSIKKELKQRIEGEKLKWQTNWKL